MAKYADPPDGGTRGPILTDDGRTIWITTTPCPTCGENLASDGRKFWCVNAKCKRFKEVE